MNIDLEEINLDASPLPPKRRISLQKRKRNTNYWLSHHGTSLGRSKGADNKNRRASPITLSKVSIQEEMDDDGRGSEDADASFGAYSWKVV
jgi:hypothetical protein